MPKKPRERYFQTRGQPHKGLDDPAKYGLTHTEVVKLINAGKWRAFVRKWQRNQKREQQLMELDYTCPKCGKVFFEQDKWIGLRCAECYRKEQAVSGSRSIRYSKNYKCISCSAASDGPDKICAKCAETLRKMRELENDA